jgi:hypothetical protein
MQAGLLPHAPRSILQALFFTNRALVNCEDRIG